MPEGRATRRSPAKPTQPPDLVEKMRDSYRKSQKYLMTVTPLSADDDVSVRIRKQMLLTVGYRQEEIDKLDLGRVSDEAVQDLMRQKLVAVMMNNGQRQKIVSSGEVERSVLDGWERIGNLSDALLGFHRALPLQPPQFFWHAGFGCRLCGVCRRSGLDIPDAGLFRPRCSTRRNAADSQEDGKDVPAAEDALVVAAALFFVSTLSIFWSLVVFGEQVRFIVWLATLVVWLVRVGVQSRMPHSVGIKSSPAQTMKVEMAAEKHPHPNLLSNFILGSQDGLVNVLGILLGLTAATSNQLDVSGVGDRHTARRDLREPVVYRIDEPNGLYGYALLTREGASG